MAQWESLFSELVSFLNLTADKEREASTALAEATVIRLEIYIRALLAIIDRIEAENGSEFEEVLGELQDLLSALQEVKSRWEDIESGTATPATLQPDTIKGPGRGRPKLFIQKEQITFLRDLRFSWTQIASLFGISRRTLYTMRCEYGLTNHEFTDISNLELRACIERIVHTMPDAGQNMIKGILRGEGIHVSVTRIRECISEVDPINTALRWAIPISRREYSVPSPNALWHINGNHKLIRYMLSSYEWHLYSPILDLSCMDWTCLIICS